MKAFTDAVDRAREALRFFAHTRELRVLHIVVSPETRTAVLAEITEAEAHPEGQAPFVIKRGDRIAQMVVAPVTQIAWSIVEQLDQTERGSGGYGSTGIAAVAQ